MLVNVLCAYLNFCDFQHDFRQIVVSLHDACYYGNKRRSNLLITWSHPLIIVAVCVVLVLSLMARCTR